MYTPWGPSQTTEKIADGITQVTTASHGGLLLSPERVKQLPPDYKPWTGDKRWAEEDEDAQIVLQAFGLLSLFHEITTLQITEDDIELGKKSRRPGYWSTNRLYYGGAISEAYKRVYGYDKDLIVSLKTFHNDGGTIFKSPGYAYCEMNDEAIEFQSALDGGEKVKPITLAFEPVIFTPSRLIKLYTLGPDHPLNNPPFTTP